MRDAGYFRVGVSQPPVRKNPTIGWRVVNILNKPTISYDSCEPPTANHIGGFLFDIFT